MSDQLDFTNLMGRPPGLLTEVLGHVVPGVAAVHAQAAPYAAAWHEANLMALAGNNRRWVVFGDSLSQRLGPPLRWPCARDPRARGMRNARLRYTSASVVGRTSRRAAGCLA
jgi:hypothetical protein